jgi:hypothetical protein
MDERYDLHQYLIDVPSGIDKFDGSLLHTKVVVSGAMVKMLHNIIVRNSTQAGRHVLEVPYAEDNSDRSRSSKLEEYAARELRMNAAHEALGRNESIVSISPVRWRLIGPWGGIAYIEYTTVPLSPWSDR